MAESTENGLLQNAMGELGDFFSWIQKALQDEQVRRTTLLSLGLDPDADKEDDGKAAEPPNLKLDSIQQYRQSVNPDEVAHQSAVAEAKKFVQFLKDYLKAFKADPLDLDEHLYRLFEIMASNYIRLRYPKAYYLFQVLGFLTEFNTAPIDVESSAGTNLVVGVVNTVPYGLLKVPRIALQNIWEFITHPIHYLESKARDLAASLPLDTKEDAENYSLLFLLLPLIIGISDNDIELDYLYSWDASVRKWSDDEPEALRTSSHGALLLADIRRNYQEKFPLPEEDIAAWVKVEKAVAEPADDIQKEIAAAYRRATRNWERGEWVDYISETFFSFSIKLPEEEGSDDAKHLGATMFFISKEDEPAELLESDGILRTPSGGLFVSLHGSGKIQYKITDNWKLIFELSSGNLLDFYLSSNADLNVMGDIRMDLSIKREKDPETGASYNLPDGSGTRLAIGDIELTGFLSKKDFGIELGIKENALVISSGKADGFLKEIMPGGDTPLKFSLATGVSKTKSYYFNHDIGFLHKLLGTEEEEKKTEAADNTRTRSLARSAEKPQEKEAHVNALDAVIPIHKDMGIAKFEKIDWSYGPVVDSEKLGGKIGVTCTFSSKIGPVFVRVEGIGMKLEASMPPAGVDLSNMELGYDFVTPSRVGLRIDAEVISGGGYLDFDSENHRYAGVLALNFMDIELAAIGLINTRLPNKQKGFSMLLSINVIFNPAYQLAYGFTLNGVGGLIGIHRTTKVRILQERIRSGAITSIMFPQNVIENAPKIISDLRAVFPPKKKHYIVAPFLKIGWGTPTIVEIDLGILVEIPFKKRLILLGSVGMYLPNKAIEKRLVELHIDVFGDFNFAESYVLIEGRLRDSHVVGIKLTGGFAFVLDWGREPQFLMSVGGYHPRYKKPDRFPDIPRLTASIKVGSSVNLTCKYYQAITSNSFQLGIRADLLVRVGSARATGLLDFNALLQFDPFRFMVDIRISVGISYRGRTFAGVDLYFEFSGPKPWRAKGYAKIKILFFSLKVRFNISWGGEQEKVLVSIKTESLLDQLHEQVAAPNNWSAKLAPGFSSGAALKKLEAEEQKERIFVHPSGYLEVRQMLLPLNKTLEKLGNKQVDRADFKITGYQIGELTVKPNKPAHLREYFSRGQFENLSDEAQLSSADFELMNAGVAIKADKAFDFPQEFEKVESDFEDILLFPEEKPASSTTARSFGLEEPSGFNWQQDRRKNVLAARQFRRSDRSEDVFGLTEELPDYGTKQYRIARRDTLETPAEWEQQYFDTYSAAKDFLAYDFQGDASKWQILEAEVVL